MNLSALKSASKGAMIVVKHHAPVIMSALGATGIVAGFGLAIKGTLNASSVIDTYKEERHVIEEAIEISNSTDNDIVYTEKQQKEDLVSLYLQTGWEFCKIYAPAFFLTTFGIGAMLGSTLVLKRRNTALMAAYTAVTAAFEKYRGEVISRFGERTDRQIRLGVHDEIIERTEVDENGKKKKVKELIEVVNDENGEEHIISPYARYYGGDYMPGDKHFTPEYEKPSAENPNYNNEYNMMRLTALESWFNKELRMKRVVFLNEVYEQLGYDRTDAGQFVGWSLDDPESDNYISFGLDKKYNRRAVNGWEPIILLDFNCKQIAGLKNKNSNALPAF